MEIQGRLIGETLRHFSSRPTFTLRELAEYTNLPREDAQAISDVVQRKGVLGIYKSTFRVTKSGKTYLAGIQQLEGGANVQKLRRQ